MIHFDDIQDDEIRIIGRQEAKGRPFYKAWWFWTALCAAILAIALTLLFAIRHASRQIPNDAVAEVIPESEAVAPAIVECEPATVIVRDTTVNDVPLRLYTPINAVPELCIGIPDTADTALILGLQAADTRADNKEIVGAFVLRGELLSRGSAKQGFCAIINGSVRIGIAESTPLLEDAINQKGYFFRQYPLVNNGRMVENKPKGKALRHALCELNGAIVVVSSSDKESLHDFAQALADLGVGNAIYLVGGEAYGFYRDIATGTSNPVVWGSVPTRQAFKNVNFIVWRGKE